MARRKRKGRPVNGIVLLDKPKGLSSNQALQKLKILFDAQKAGHTGSLDPLATGMLPVCFGEATKLSGFLLNADKAYRARCLLGLKTDSADADGQVIATRSAAGIGAAQIQAVLREFVGEIEQVPPMHSALKKNGVPLYKLAHQGLSVERESRSVQIYELALLDVEGQYFDIHVHCSKGTYIRTLVDDIGERLGCGAHVVALHRDKVGPFQAADMHDFEELSALREQGLATLDGILLNMDQALTHWPSVQLSLDASFYLQQGQAIFVPKLPQQGWLRLYREDGCFLGVGEVNEEGKIAPKRLMDLSKIG